jgi:glycosyltransferase involved in cell wall biosynthesis
VQSCVPQRRPSFASHCEVIRHMDPRRLSITAFATQGSGGSVLLDDERRLRTLLGRFDATYLRFDRAHKLSSFVGVLRAVLRERPHLIVMEGTGIAGGAAVLAARALLGSRYLVSSGDAVAPFVAAIHPSLHAPFFLYECLLYRFSAGFIGWTPYLAGRALTLGAPAAMTAPGWAPFAASGVASEVRSKLRERLDIPQDALVFGIVGSLAWNERLGYGYGVELVRALSKALVRPDLYVLIVGDGAGRAKLEAEVSLEGRPRIRFTGRVPRDEVPSYLSAMDVASLPQSVDQLGSFRYTTKLSEYLSLSLPVVTNTIPLSYDLPGEWFFRLAGRSPWDPLFIDNLAELMKNVTFAEIERKRQETGEAAALFNLERQLERFSAFVLDRCSNLT